MTDGAAKKEFVRLCGLIGKYAHRWGECPSSRLLGWVDRYNELRDEKPEAFDAYCEDQGYTPAHDAYDCLA